MTFEYPPVRRDEAVKDIFHGVEIQDPYRWLENPDSEEVKAFVDAQNSVTNPFLESYLFRESLRKDLTDLWNYPKIYLPSREGDKYFHERNSGLQNQNVTYIQETLQSEPKVFLDPNELSEDGTVSLQKKSFSKDGKTLAYGLCEAGSDWVEIKFKDVETGKDYDEVLKRVKFTGMSWMHDHKGFFYSAYLTQEGKTDGSETTELKNQKLYYHELRTDQSKDITAVGFDDPSIGVYGEVSDCGNYLIVSSYEGTRNNCLYYVDLKSHAKGEEPMNKFELHPIVTVFEADYEYLTNDGNKFYIKTNKKASNSRVIIIDFKNPKETNWKTLIPEHPTDVLEWCAPINQNQMVLVYLRDVKHVMYLYDLTSGKKIKQFDLPIGSVCSISGERHHKELFFSMTSFLTPTTTYRIDFSKNDPQPEVLHETKIGNVKTEDFEAKQVFYESKDGTKVPMYIVRKKNLRQDGLRPCFLYGYGGFNISETPSFSISRLLFMGGFDGVFAVANIRGGGEYGEDWYKAGRLENKQNGFDDFQYAAKYLISEGYTNNSRLVIQGGSNGGLLVAACINQAPELFGAAVCFVGVLDMLRFHKFTIGYAWKTEYGNPDEEKDFKCLYKYSPLHNIQVPKNGGQYPATLLLTADHDDRVVPLHSFKFISELQYKIGSLPQQKNPLMIRIETRAGHGAGKPTAKKIEEVVDYFCFVGKSLGLEYKSVQ